MQKLPVEIVHRIFDHLDIETIFFSIRPVCRSFQSIALNYDRFDFHLKLSSKSHFDVLCRFLPPENIRSLTLYNNEQIPDQISTFLQQVRLRQLTRLHSIDLDGIDEFQLNYLFKRLNVNLLRSFSIRINQYDYRRRKTIVNYLSTVVKQTNLRNLYLNIKNSRISDLSWPINSSIKCLTINENMKFDNLMKIFSCSPELHRLIILETFFGRDTDHRKGYSFVQLKSLTIEKVDCSMNKLESFLCLTPSLSSLKLSGRCSTFDGKRWEDFVQINLPHLDQFQFDLRCYQMSKQTSEDFHSMIEPFRSPFWLEHKKWFVQFQWHPLYSFNYKLYSIPMCESSFDVDLSLKKEIISTSDERFQATGINEIISRLEISSTEPILTSMNVPFFSNVTKLNLYFDGKMWINSRNLSRMINLRQLVEVQLDFHYLDPINVDFLCHILALLDQPSKLSMLIIRSLFHQDYMYPYFKRIFRKLPSQIKYLQIPIKDIEQIPMIVQHCHQLRVLQIPKTRLSFSKQTREWFDINTIGSIVSQSFQYDTIWIGKIQKTNQSNPKRMKLSE